MAGDIECLRLFDGTTNPEAVADPLHHAEAVLPLPGKADIVLGVDGQWDGFGEVREAVPILRRKRPHLSTGDRPSPLHVGLCPCLTETQWIAIALVVVGSGSCAKKVGLKVSAQRSGGELALGQQRDTRLPPAGVELRENACRRAGRMGYR